MKWKSVSPDVKRRDSPKFKQTYASSYSSYSPSYQSYNPSKLSYYTDDDEYEYRGNDHYAHDNQYQAAFEDYYLKQTERYNDDNRENYDYHNHSYQQSPAKRPQTVHDFSEDEEDELYFYGGGGGGRNKNLSKNKKNSDIADDYEYNPNDFESEEEEEEEVESSSSSWTSEDEEIVIKKKRPSIISSTTKQLKTGVVNKEMNASSIRPKAYAPKIVDLDAPTVMKLPPNPIPDTWAHIVHNPLKHAGKMTREILTPSVREREWLEGLKLVNPVQGILMRPPFDDETFTIRQWAKFMQKLLPSVMEDGYLFVWVEREELAGVIRAAESLLSFKYVENLCWIRRDLSGRMAKELPAARPALFYKSKMTLLILRRDPQNRCKLRHQRNPDCIFDFAGERMPDGRVYDVIEMLLDGSKLPGPHLLHLWAGASEMDRLVYSTRHQWIRIIEQGHEGEGERDTSEEHILEDTVENIEDSAVSNDDQNDNININIPSTFDEDFCNFITCEPTIL